MEMIPVLSVNVSRERGDQVQGVRVDWSGGEVPS